MTQSSGISKRPNYLVALSRNYPVCCARKASSLLILRLSTSFTSQGGLLTKSPCITCAAAGFRVDQARKEESLVAYFKAFGSERCAEIEAISLDMWPAFIGACRTNVPGADQKMVFDRFHIMQHVGRGVDRVRRQEHKALMAAGDTTLARSKYL